MTRSVRDVWIRPVFVMIAAVMGLIACSDGGPVTEIDSLDDALSLWHDVGPASYTVAIERQCFCGPDGRGPVRVTVINGKIVGQVYVASGASVTGDAQGWFPDVDGLFEILRGAMDDGAHEIRVTYDPANGVPVDFWIDYDENTADEELGFLVTESVQPTS